MKKEVISASEDADIAELAQLMLAAHVKRVPIVADAVVVGIVSRRDLVRVLARSDGEIQRDLEGLLRREGLLDADIPTPVDGGVATIPDPNDEKARALLRSVAATVPGLLGVVFNAAAGAEAERVIEVLDEDESLRLLTTRDLGRIAFVVEGRPQIRPVNYAVDNRMVVMRTAPGLMLDSAPGSCVAFEVDGYEVGAGLRWSVVVHGVAQDVTTSIDAFSAALRSLDVRPIAPGERRHWLAIYPNEITGRRFASVAPTPT
jgi:CBS domain-containing protein